MHSSRTKQAGKSASFFISELMKRNPKHLYCKKVHIGLFILLPKVAGKHGAFSKYSDSRKDISTCTLQSIKKKS